MSVAEQFPAAPLDEDVAASLVHLWMRELCVIEPKSGPERMRRWYLALTSEDRRSFANDNGEAVSHIRAAMYLRSLCRSCKHRCALPLA